MKTALNGRMNKITMEFTEQMTKAVAEATSHEFTLPGSKGCMSRATSPELNHIIPPTFSTGE